VIRILILSYWHSRCQYIRLSIQEYRATQQKTGEHYLWRAVEQDGEVVDVYLQARRDLQFIAVLILLALFTHNVELHPKMTHQLH